MIGVVLPMAYSDTVLGPGSSLTACPRESFRRWFCFARSAAALADALTLVEGMAENSAVPGLTALRKGAKSWSTQGGRAQRAVSQCQGACFVERSIGKLVQKQVLRALQQLATCLRPLLDSIQAHGLPIFAILAALP